MAQCFISLAERHELEMIEWEKKDPSRLKYREETQEMIQKHRLTKSHRSVTIVSRKTSKLGWR